MAPGPTAPARECTNISAGNNHRTRAGWQLWNFRGKERPHRISVGANCGQPTRRGYLFSRCRRLFWWDRLDILYFRGEALWNYLTFPALLLRDDISWTQIFDNTLEARFPSHLPTHCEVQRFHFDPASRLLRQHDYTADAFGSSAKAANVVLEHKIWDAVPFPYKRRVTPRAPDGTPRGGPTLIWIEIDDWSIR